MILVFLAVFCGSSYWHRHSRRSTARKIAAEMIRVEVHQVKALSFYQTLPDSSYLIGKYEVTQQQYRIVMGANPSAHRHRRHLPVEMVSWLDAIEFCNQLSIMSGLTPCYSFRGQGTDPDLWISTWKDRINDLPYQGYCHHLDITCDWSADGYRLPTSAEWSYAAQGGEQSQSYLFSGGDEIDAVAWVFVNSLQNYKINKTHPVGKKQPNELGLHDMSGNVSEFVWDMHRDLYATIGKPIPCGQYRLLKGGNFQSSSAECIPWTSAYTVAFAGNKTIGFRLCRRAL
jgi:formylglycine-generating enzyme required for sulfatase activity